MVLLAIAAFADAGPALAQGNQASTSGALAANAMEITGQHRGFTNEKIFLRQDDGKELTFVVAIPGDTERKWQKEFATLSRITVTYVPGPAGGLPTATAIRRATDGDKK